MPRETHHLLHPRILPHDDLVLTIPVRANDLIGVLAPREVAHLRTRVYLFDHAPGTRVPELDAPVGGPAAGGEQMVLMRGPGDGLHGGHVAAEAVERGF